MNKKINDDEIIINNGEKEFLLKILFTYENEDRNAKYCFVYEESNPDDVFVYRYGDEGNIFEIEDDIDSSVTLIIDDVTYELKIRDLLYTSKIYPLLDEVSELLKERYQFTEFYRSDSWWHNCYKIKVGQAVPYNGYHAVAERTIDTTDCQNIRVRVWQKNGSVAWSSPIFMK